MSLGATTITIKINAVDKILKRINQDNFTTRYYLHEATQEFTVNIRHSKESPQKNGTLFDRHNVEIIQTVFATDTSPEINRSVYVVIRNSKSDDYTAVGYVPTALADLLKVSGNVDDLLSWVS